MENQAYVELKNVLKTDHESVIGAMHRLDSIMLYTFANHKNILDWYYFTFNKRLFPEVTEELFPSAVSSYYHALCADYYRIAGMKKEQREESYKAFELHSRNSLAVVQIAYDTCIKYITSKVGSSKEDRKNAEDLRKKAKEMFEESLSLVKNQFDGFPITRISIEATAHAGLGYLYSRSGQYRKAERCYRDALSKIELSPKSKSPFLQSMKYFVLLNRGRNRLDNGRFEEAKKDFDEASKDPDLVPYVETNMGILCYKQSFNGKAKSKFNHAIELKPDLVEAYYNLGVIYNEEGIKEKAIRLFNTALDIDEDLSEAYNALEKLEGPKVQDIRDWYNWWFGRETSRYKKGIGTVSVALILLGITWTIYDIHMTDSTVSTSIFGVLGFALIFLILPLITKLKLGTVEVEMESKGERPLCYANGPSLKAA